MIIADMARKAIIRGENGMAAIGRAKVEFEQPTRQVLAMLLALGAVGVVVFLLYQPIEKVFLANIGLNGLISGVFVIGLISTFWQVLASCAR